MGGGVRVRRVEGGQNRVHRRNPFGRVRPLRRTERSDPVFVSGNLYRFVSNHGPVGPWDESSRPPSRYLRLVDLLVESTKQVLCPCVVTHGVGRAQGEGGVRPCVVAYGIGTGPGEGGVRPPRVSLSGGRRGKTKTGQEGPPQRKRRGPRD